MSYRIPDRLPKPFSPQVRKRQLRGGTLPPPPPNPPPLVDIKVLYTKNGQTFGPFNEAQLKAKIAAGEINRKTLIWMEGMDGWRSADTVQTMTPFLVAIPPEPLFDANAYQVGTWGFQGTTSTPDGTPVESSASFTYRTDGTLTEFSN